MKGSVIASAFLAVLCASQAPAAVFELQKGDHVCIIGNTLAERMQHVGWMETYLHARFPEHRLTFRNLGYSADEVELSKRLRSMDFGSPDQWLAGNAPVPQPKKLSPRDDVPENRFHLTNTKADVIFAFFGYNESFGGEAGLLKFKADLDGLLKHMLGQKYNGKSSPRIVLFSPTAFENLKSPNLPDGAVQNANLKIYAAAMAEVAKANDVRFVDLFNPTATLFSKGGVAHTINGIHLNDAGDQAVAKIINESLFGATINAPSAEKLEKLRAAVNDKNFFWHNRYRTTDGFSTYGDRAFLKFSEGPGGYGDGRSNYGTVQRELEVLDVMTSNRDQRVWAAAQGKDLKVDDNNLPPFFEVISNKPGPLPGGKHVFLGGEEAISKMTLGKNLKVNLVASEEKFPELINPVQMSIDNKGRVWVAAWPTYPHWKPHAEEMNDKLLILEDTDGDGKADKCITFADHLHNPTGFEFWNGGVLVAMAPDILFLKDTDGDDKADVRTRVLHGLDTADTHHTANSFTLDPGGALYFQEGTFHHTQVETPWGPPQRVANGAVFRFEPRSSRFDVYVSHGFANPHGHAFDRWGQDIVVDGTGANPYHAALFSGHIDFPNKHNRPPQVYQQRTRPCPGIEYISSSHFPDDWRGNLLVGNVIGVQGILRYKVYDKDSSFGAEELEPVLLSSDPNFRPADLEVGADGAIYFTDWQNPIIGHMQHNLRDPSRDKIHGRVYRITYEGRELATPAKIAGATIDQLLNNLKSPDDRVRYRTRIELTGRKTDEVLDAVNRWTEKFDQKDPDYERLVLETLWIHQSHNVVNPSLLERVLASPEFRARAAAVRVLCYWRDRLSNGLELLKKAAADEAPRVRLEAIRAASFYPQAEAAEIPIIAAELPSDPYLDFLTKETMRTLDPIVKAATDKGERIAFTTDAGQRFFLKKISTEQLLKENRTRPVFLEMLYRPGLQDEQRREAVAGLAKLDNKPELRVVMDAIRDLDAKQAAADVSVVFDLVRQLTARRAAELATARAELEKLALTAKQPILRQIGFVSLINVDGTADKAWALATQNAKSIVDFVNATSLISDASLRASLYDRLLPLLKGLPDSLSGAGNTKGTQGRFVRIELPRKGTLTLAEVEVMSNGRNVALGGKASQKNTAHGGDAKRGIDGNKSADFNGAGQTHTEENTDNPWWEVDLGEEQPIDQIVVYNREGELGKRLDGFTLKVLAANRDEVFKQERIPAPAASAAIALEGGGSAALVRRAAMDALTHVRGQELKTFQSLAEFVKGDVDRIHAIRALQRLPRNTWPKDAAAGLVEVLLDSVKKIPTADRTSPAALDQLEFAEALSTLLPVDQAKSVRAQLGELGVRVIRLGTIFEKMSFDKDVVVVKAGKPVEFVLDNSDLMPHNFVISQPGSLEEIGLISETSAQQPGFIARNYVPQSDKILLSSRLLFPRESQKLSFNAPQQPGVYPFVCTYPGHWRRMHGALYVVEDLDDYLAAPEEYLTLHPLDIKDPLLKDRRPRTEWKYDELAAALSDLGKGQTYGNGQQMFKVAACIGCHKMDGQGKEFGPDLTKLDLKLKPADILKDILEPSSRINEKYQSNVFQLFNGKVITGLVLEESGDLIKVVENPLVATDPVIIKRGDVEERTRSKTSIMPKGLLDKLTRDEILELVAYVTARGDKKSEVWSGSAHDHHNHGGEKPKGASQEKKDKHAGHKH